MSDEAQAPPRLPPLQAESCCVKCRLWDHHAMTYVPPSPFIRIDCLAVGGDLHDRKEHMHRRCLQCRYEWAEDVWR